MLASDQRLDALIDVPDLHQTKGLLKLFDRFRLMNTVAVEWQTRQIRFAADEGVEEKAW